VDVLVSEIERALALTDTPARAAAAVDFEARGRELPVVLRGYDRSQVQAYLHEVVRDLRS
jgi:DivIVA domain-containing protein